MRSQTTMRLAWLATHPIQYQAPILREIAKCKDIDLTAIFFSDFSTRGFVDTGFGRSIEWDTPLLEGYKYEFLPGTGENVQSIDTFSPRIKGLRERINRDNYDAILVQGWQHYGMVKAAWLAKRAGLQVLMRCEATDHVVSSTGLKGILREAAVRFLLGQIDTCLAIGTHNRNFYLSRGIPLERIGSMPYCVDNNHFQKKAEETDLSSMRSDLSLADDRPIILYAGKLTRRKYPDLLLKAYKKLPKPRPYLIYVGDGELRNSLEETVKEEGFKDVRFVGFQNQGQLPSYYALASIFVLPSINEPFGLVVNEAMNAQCAIIVTDQVGSSVDLVKSGENGFVIAPNNEDLLSEALIGALEGNQSGKMGKNSLKIIENWGIKENVCGLRKALGLPNGD